RRGGRGARGHGARGRPRAAYSGRVARRHRDSRGESRMSDPIRIETPAELAPYIQHTLIEAGTTRERVIAHAREAIEHGVNAARVAGSWVDVVASELRGTGVQVASALDFPSCGTMTTTGKAREAEELVRLGAQQLDIGVQVGWLR